jgi:tripeptidyl-peptidase-1
MHQNSTAQCRSSHPDSENYGKHWTFDEVIDMFASKERTVDAVKEWLVEFGIGPGRVSVAKQMLARI